MLYIFMGALIIFYIGVVIMSYGIKKKIAILTGTGIVMYIVSALFIIMQAILFITKLI